MSVVAAALLLAGPAAADQASQPGAPAAGHIAAGDTHSCAVLSGSVFCWGFGANGALGYGNTATIGDNEAPDVLGPVALGAGRTAVAVSAGNGHSCALLDDGAVRCWGFGANGRLGYANTDTIGDNETPAALAPVNLGRPATAITAGNGHTCAILNDASVRCWGFNLDGRLGYGRTDSIGDDEAPGSLGPINLGPGRTARAIAAGGFHTCALLDDGNVRCWGFGGTGRLGYGKIADIGRTPDATPETAGPVYLGPGRTATAITAGFGHTCAVLDNRTVLCWGFPGEGRLGYGNLNPIGDDELPGMVAPVDLGSGRTALAIDAGREHTCALLDAGAVRCWGFNGFGQLGIGSTFSVGGSETPGSVATVNLGAGRTALAVSAGLEHTCALLDDTSVRCWGRGSAGRLGYCDELTIGNDELPAAAGPVALSQPGIARPPACPAIVVPPPPLAPPPAAVIDVPPAARPGSPAPVPDGLAAALAAQRARAALFAACQRSSRTRFNADRRRARRFAGGRRRLALRLAATRAAQRRGACRKRHGRVPGRIADLTAAATGGGKVRLTFRVAGTDGTRGPAARRYVIRQSVRPIRTALDFRRATSLCRGSCAFNVRSLQSSAALTVTNLRRNGRYYYAVAALDNVSSRRGPRSSAVAVRVR